MIRTISGGSTSSGGLLYTGAGVEARRELVLQRKLLLPFPADESNNKAVWGEG